MPYSTRDTHTLLCSPQVGQLLQAHQSINVSLSGVYKDISASHTSVREESSHQLLHGVVGEDQPLQVWDTLHKVGVNPATRTTHITSQHITPHILPPPPHHTRLLLMISIFSRLNIGNPSTLRMSLSERSMVSNWSCQYKRVEQHAGHSQHRTVHTNGHRVAPTQLHMCDCSRWGPHSRLGLVHPKWSTHASRVHHNHPHTMHFTVGSECGALAYQGGAKILYDSNFVA